MADRWKELFAMRRNLDLETAAADAAARYAAANPESRARFEAARGVMPGGNTRTTLHFDPFPVTIVEGRAATLTDLDGHRYTDFLGEYTAGLYGHSEPAIAAAVKAALDAGTVLGGPNVYEARFAELVCTRFPAVEKVRFCNSGTEANLMNLCLARAATGRHRIMAMDGGYHGGVLAFANGGSPINAPFDVVLGHYNDTDATAALIQAHAADLAAVILEPMMGAAGCIAARPDFLAMLRAETRRCGIVLVFDEVMTSRLAPGGLHERTGVDPDLVSFGKYLGGGLTFGAFGGRADLMALLDPTNPDALSHSGTYNNNVLTMAAGVAGLERVYTPDAVAALNARGDRLRRDLQAVADRLDVPVTITGIGSMLALHHRRGRIETPADANAVDPAARKLVHLELLLRGFYIARRGFMSLCLPLTDADLERFVAAVDDVLAENRHVLRNAAAAA